MIIDLITEEKIERLTAAIVDAMDMDGLIDCATKAIKDHLTELPELDFDEEYEFYFEREPKEKSSLEGGNKI